MRRAFSVPAEGRAKSIALDAYPDLENPEVAASKLSRILSATGDLNPPWEVLDVLAQADPGAVLRSLSEAWGYEPPKRMPDSDAVLLERMTTAVESLAIHADQLVLQMRQLARRPAMKVGSRHRNHGAGGAA